MTKHGRFGFSAALMCFLTGSLTSPGVARAESGLFDGRPNSLVAQIDTGAIDEDPLDAEDPTKKLNQTQNPSAPASNTPAANSPTAPDTAAGDPTAPAPSDATGSNAAADQPNSTGSADSGEPVAEDKAATNKDDQQAEQELLQEVAPEAPAVSTERPMVLAPQEQDQEHGAAASEGRDLAILTDGADGKTRNKICNCRFATEVPYTERRSTFGAVVGIYGGQYAPTNYDPDFVTKNFDDYYGSGKTPNVEFALGLKFNFFLGSITAQGTAGYFSAKNTQTAGAESTLTVYPITAGLLYALDNFFKEPYVVPYVNIGLYSAIYNESVAGLSVKGNSPFAPFYAVGLMFQLDWIDTDSHASGYEDFGLENTFLFVEGRSFLKATTGSTAAADFSTPLQINGGLKLEF